MKRKGKEMASVSQYAKKCGVSKTTIRNRIEAGTITASFDEDFKGLVIDLKKFPCKPANKPGRKNYGN